MSYIIACLNLKGGCGKTTLATCLAAALASSGHATALVDADSQPSSSDWHKSRSERLEAAPITLRSLAPEENLREAINGLKATNSHIVIDVGGRLTLRAVGATSIADKILIPLSASMPDIRATKSYIDDVLAEISMLKTVDAALVINTFRQTNVNQMALDAILALGLPVLDTRLGYRTTYQEAIARGLGVTEFAPNSAAAAEIEVLLAEIMGAKA